LLFLTGLGGIGKSTALYAVQSYLRLNDKFRIVYIHNVEKLFESSEELKNEIYFTFYQEISQGNSQVKGHSEFINEVKAFESKESQKTERILEEVKKMFELLIKHCRAIKKKLILIIDNYNKIDSLMNSKKDAKKDFATELNGVFRGLECGLTIISASCNNETQENTKKIIPLYYIYSHLAYRLIWLIMVIVCRLVWVKVLFFY
jgi:hypothetical protein